MATSLIASAVQLELPENWKQILMVVAAVLLLWLRTAGANPTLDAIRKLLGGLLAWPEPDPLKQLEAEGTEGVIARAAVLARLRVLAAKRGDSALLQQFDAVVSKINGGA